MARDIGVATPEGLDEPSQHHRRWAGLLRSIVLPIAILAVILGALWYWDSGGGGFVDDPRYGVVPLPAELNATDRGPLPEVGRAGPDFLLEQPGGGELRLSDFQGHPVLLNFWASWCPPCRAEIPELVAAFERYGARGLVVIGVDLQEPDGTILAFAEEFGITFPLAVDRDGELSDVWRLGGPIDGIPTSYFLDETGIVRAFFYGPMKEDDLEERLALILPEAGD